MKKSFFLVVVLTATTTHAQQLAPQAAPTHMLAISKTAEDVQSTVTLLGRGCRASSDTDWINVCTIAINQAVKEMDALKIAKAKEELKLQKPALSNSATEEKKQ